MSKRFRLSILILCIAAVSLFAGGSSESVVVTKPYVASTSWTAAFADIAGLDGVVTIAPASLRHPPEYEITAGDIRTVVHAQLFVAAGYEGMMATIRNAAGLDDSRMVKITTNNSIQTVRQQTEAIALAAGTLAQQTVRMQEYEDVIMAGKEAVHAKGLDGVPALVHAMQVPLAQELGLDIQGTFGPAPATAQQIAEAAKGSYALIIDNVHNPVAGPLAEVSPQSQLVQWRNFPQEVGRGALASMVGENIHKLLD